MSTDPAKTPAIRDHVTLTAQQMEAMGRPYLLTHAPFFSNVVQPVVYHPNPRGTEALTPQLLEQYGLDTSFGNLAMVMLTLNLCNEQQVCAAADAWCELGRDVVVCVGQMDCEPEQSADDPCYVEGDGGLFRPTAKYIRHVTALMAANNEAIVNPPDLQLLIAAAVIKTEMRLARSAA